MSHAHVAGIHAVEEVDGVAFIAMEYVEGEPLSSVLARRPLDGQAVVRYGIQIADAVAHAHDHRVIHCDIKSHNVMVTPDGRAKVLDFGVGRRLPREELDALTETRDGAGGHRRRHTRLHGARDPRRSVARRAERHLVPGRAAVRDGVGACAVQRADGICAHCGHHRAAAGAAA